MDDGRGGPASLVSRARFELQFDDDDGQAFPIDLFPRTGRTGWNPPVSAMVGRPFRPAETGEGRLVADDHQAAGTRSFQAAVSRAG